MCGYVCDEGKEKKKKRGGEKGRWDSELRLCYVRLGVKKKEEHSIWRVWWWRFHKFHNTKRMGQQWTMNIMSSKFYFSHLTVRQCKKRLSDYCRTSITTMVSDCLVIIISSIIRMFKNLSLITLFCKHKVCWV